MIKEDSCMRKSWAWGLFPYIDFNCTFWQIYVYCQYLFKTEFINFLILSHTHLSGPGAGLSVLVSSSRCRCSLLCCSTCILLHRKSPATRRSTRWCLLLRRATPALWRRSNVRSYVSSSGWNCVSWAWLWHMIALNGLGYTWNNQHYKHSTQSKSNTVIPWKTLSFKIPGHLWRKKLSAFCRLESKN